MGGQFEPEIRLGKLRESSKGFWKTLESLFSTRFAQRLLPRPKKTRIGLDGDCSPWGKKDTQTSFKASLLGARTLLGAPGIATRNKKLLGGSWPYY